MTEDERMDADARLARLFAEDGLADRDPVFSTAVGEAIARRRLRQDLAWLLLVAGLATLVLWSLAPALMATLGPVAKSLAPALIAGVLLASLHAAVSPVLRRA